MGCILSGTSPVSPFEILSLLTFIFSASQPEYDAFATLGNPGWDWASINAHINAVEHFHTYAASPPNALHPAGGLRYAAADNPADHGTAGAVQVSYSNFWRVPEPVVPAFLDTFAVLGVPRNEHPVS